MRRSSLVPVAFISCLCGLWGCTTPQGGPAFAWLRGDRAPEQHEPEPNPLKPDDEQEVLAQSEPDLGGPSAEDERSAAAQPDAETLKMIREELEYVAKEDRQELYSTWVQLDRETLAETLNIHRMLRDHEPDRKRATSPADGDSLAQAGYASPGERSDALGSRAARLAGRSPAETMTMRIGAPAGTAPTGAGSIYGDVASSPLQPTSPRQPDTRLPSRQIRTVTGTRSGSQAPVAYDNFGHSSYGRPQTAPSTTTYDAHSSNGPSTAAMPSQSVASYDGRSHTVPHPEYGRTPSGNRSTLPSGPADSIFPSTAEPPTRAASFQGEAQPPIGGYPGAANGFGAPHASAELPAGQPGGDRSQWYREVDQLLAMAEADVARTQLGSMASPEREQRYIEKHVHLRMLYLMSGQPARAMEPIPGIEPADQEFWTQTFFALTNYFDFEAMPERNVRASQTIAQLELAVQKLQEHADLELRNVNFCHKITSFGNYEKFERDEFSPGQPVLVYAEVSNFRSEPATRDEYRTVLKSTIEILTPNGQLVERMTFPATEDLCRNFRQDYFHSYEFTVPQRIGFGPHVLKLTVEDQLSRKLSSETMNFTVR